MSNTTSSRADALREYANPLNWDVDVNGIRRVWREPGSTTPDAYNGFELARAALSAAQEAPVCLSKTADSEEQSTLPLADAPQCRLAAPPVAQDAPAKSPYLVERTAPERIYLDLGFAPAGERPTQFSDLAEVTWSEDDATGHGVKYVRADLVAAQVVPHIAPDGASDAG